LSDAETLGEFKEASGKFNEVLIDFSNAVENSKLANNLGNVLTNLSDLSDEY
jgi:hypothetical protein